jgi:dephospho-CoA kinase
MKSEERLFGIYGPYCSGKNACAAVAEAYGITVIDVDKLGHAVLMEPSAIEEIAAAFGEGVLLKQGGIDRKALGSIVFNDQSAMARLEAISHPRLFALVDRALRDRKSAWACLNAAILPRMPHAHRCRFAVRVGAPFPLRLVRAMRRDALSLPAAWSRLRSQRSLLSQPFPPDVDIYSISNHRGLASLEARMEAILKREAL